VAKKKKKKGKLTLGQKASLMLANPGMYSDFIDFMTQIPMQKGGYIKCPTKKKKPRGVGAALKGYGKALS
jgi:hypothetical protein|tara:strand:+ start:228 stop:437 length:210 start_codon:yes stop_codon:yes gene_type:complete